MLLFLLFRLYLMVEESAVIELSNHRPLISLNAVPFLWMIQMRDVLAVHFYNKSYVKGCKRSILKQYN
jgi:hypothetical protein